VWGGGVRPCGCLFVVLFLSCCVCDLFLLYRDESDHLALVNQTSPAAFTHSAYVFTGVLFTASFAFTGTSPTTWLSSPNSCGIHTLLLCIHRSPIHSLLCIHRDESDHLAVVDAYHRYQHVRKTESQSAARKFCDRHFLSERTLQVKCVY